MRPCLAIALLLALAAAPAAACTNLLVTPGASADGSAFITYTCDGEFHPILQRIPAADHAPGEMQEVRYWDGTVTASIPWPAHTYAVVGLMNEHQVAVGETTFDGRLELLDETGGLHYWNLMTLALQRARTAREAVEVITSLIETHGYRSTGESFSLCDPRECWLLEMIGAGPGSGGAVWVARRLPDGTVSAHANLARIGTFPTDDPQNCLYSRNVFSVAEARGWYDPRAGVPFNFREVYCPATAQKKRYTATRVWSLLRRAAPSLELSPDFHRGVAGAEDYPLFVKPDRKLALADVMSLMRDHYEGTDYDMTQGVDAGPFGCPDRWRPMAWEQDGETYTWERPISTQQTGFSHIAQSRRGLPDPVGGCLWYGVDDTDTTVWFPLYAGITDVPPSFARGALEEFSWDSGWWVFNLVANYAGLKYSYMIEDIRAAQRELEGGLIAMQPAVEATAARLHAQDPALCARYLTTYSVGEAERVAARWQTLAGALIAKYNDGYVIENGREREVGYPQAWRDAVLKLRPEQFRLPRAAADSLATALPY
ncbi:MAG: C69 family dipeptidase [bacterium]|nr:C69 family dipeptidase [bacterium]